jgi:hypothetical protein
MQYFINTSIASTVSGSEYLKNRVRSVWTLSCMLLVNVGKLFTGQLLGMVNFSSGPQSISYPEHARSQVTPNLRMGMLQVRDWTQRSRNKQLRI